MDEQDFAECFESLTGYGPFPWQRELYSTMLKGSCPDRLDVPTGLGKTNVIAVWLIALAQGAQVPRRLAYVVNRRTVVDQTNNEVERLRSNLAKPELSGLCGSLHQRCAMPREDDQPPLAISTLRGQFADNREWFADPSRPAVICGTVDMIGSRLLFGGYRIGFRSRPLHAGLLGQDTLLVHDEAHLEPAFQKLVESIQREQAEGEKSVDVPWPRFRVMAMSATVRSDADHVGSCLSLQPEDHAHSRVQQRTAAAKALHLHSVDDENKRLAEHLARHALDRQESGDAVLIFARRVDHALEVYQKLAKAHPGQVTPLTGTMRGHERDRLVRSDSVFARFMPEPDRPADVTPAEGTVYLVCTAAGEVGVNFSADHMVADLTTFESMAQRLGRVNRFGNRDDTHVDVVHPDSFDEKDPLSPPRQATLKLLKQLDGDGSSKAIGELLNGLDATQRNKAFAPTPTIPQATDILFDTWAMTTIQGDMPGRPPVAPYLHGIADWEPARTSVAWREEVKVLKPALIERHGEGLRELLAEYPLKPHELLGDTTERVYKALTDVAKRTDRDMPIWLVSERGDVTPEQLGELLAADKKQVIERLAACTILLPPTLGGLSGGMLDTKADNGDDVADQWQDGDDKLRRRRMRSDDRTPATGPAGMALIRTVDTDPDADEAAPPDTDPEDEGEGETEADGDAKIGRFWHWYVRPVDAEDATPASLRPVTWQDHTDAVVSRTREIARRLSLPDDLQCALVIAAEWHDLGKQRELWQRTIGNPNPTDWHAKPGKPEGGPRWRPRPISKYRHEFGSLLDVLDDRQPYLDRLDAMTPEMRDVVLHLIAAHHGYARPHFPAEREIDPAHPQSFADEASAEALRRYARLQRRYGRWGLAYLESLLRAADWAASAEPSPSETSQETPA